MEQLDAEAQPVVITQSEFMRRMKEMAATGGGNPMMGFYGEMPDSYNLVVNTAHPLVDTLLKTQESECADKIKPLQTEIEQVEKRRNELKSAHKDTKEDEIPQAEKAEIETIDKRVSELNNRKKEVYATFAVAQPKIKQMIDIALLANNMLKGKDLADFVKRSISLLN